MKNNLPTAIFDLLSTKDFTALSESEKVMVLSFMSQIEYEALYHSYQKTSHFFQEKAEIEPSHKVLLALQAAIPPKPAPTSILLQPIPLWKAVAAVLLLAFAWLLQSFFSPSISAEKNIVYVPVHDTLELTKVVKEIDTFIQYAPVFVHKKAQTSSNKETKIAKNTQQAPLFAEQNIESKRDTPVQFVSDIYTMTRADLDKALQKRNGKNLEEDRLSKQFGFVSM